MKKLLLVLLAIAVILLLFAAYVNYTARRLPSNNPEAFLATHSPSDRREVIVCIGDSITHGAVSSNYVEMLEKDLPKDRYALVNAGINGEFAYNVVQRLDAIVKIKPAYVIILIGTNDAAAMLSRQDMKIMMKEMRLPREPDAAWYRENLSLLCKRLRRETDARIALLSLPVIGEDPAHQGFAKSREYSAIIKGIAAKEGLAYLPLNETMIAHLKKNPSSPRYGYEKNMYVMYKSIIMHCGFGRSWDEVSASNGFGLLSDFLHLSDRGAAMTARLIEGFILGR